MITADRILVDGRDTSEYTYDMVNRDDAITAMLEFARIHVKAALEAAYKNADFKEEDHGDEQICYTTNDYGDSFVLDKDSIINAYDLNNIK